MKLMQKAIRCLTDEAYRFDIQNVLGWHRGMSDEAYLKKKYRLTFGRDCDLENPKTFTEKLQWIKLYDRRPIYTVMVDKAAAKEYVQSVIGAEHVVPTIAVYDDVSQIDFQSLPQKFVMKCTHNSGRGMCICTNKDELDQSRVRRGLEQGLREDYYLTNREWPYKNVKPRIIVEQFLEDRVDGELRDYKFFCFNGEPKVLYIAQGRGQSETFADFYDMDFQHLDLKIDHEIAPQPPHKPVCFEQMKAFAAKLSKDIPHVRVDFYEVNGHVYFGELTFFHCSGFEAFHPEWWDEIFGSWIRLPEKTITD